MKLTLIRHGMTEGNRRSLYYGRTELPLLPEGIAELEAQREQGGYPQAKRYYTSGMLRTEQTFQILYGTLPHEALYGLREIDFGDFEMKTYEELKDDPQFQQWLHGDMEVNVCPNGESSAQVTVRAKQALAAVLAAGEDTVCVVHGGVIANLMNDWFPKKKHRYAWTPKPGHGYQIEFQNGRPVSYCTVPIE